ncbi:hypothetical protein KM043_005882 [Ampulex compressa]|nr:hypothetical protein KM043_005882 [Ampulex compressa]
MGYEAADGSEVEDPVNQERNEVERAGAAILPAKDTGEMAQGGARRAEEGPRDADYPTALFTLLASSRSSSIFHAQSPYSPPPRIPLISKANLELHPSFKSGIHPGLEQTREGVLAKGHGAQCRRREKMARSRLKCAKEGGIKAEGEIGSGGRGGGGEGTGEGGGET